MAKRQCPPGVFCIENMTIMFICGIFVIIGLFVYTRAPPYLNKNVPANASSLHERNSIYINTAAPSLPKGRGDDVFYDIYQPPLRDDRFMTGGALDIRGNVAIGRRPIPINVSTQGTDDSAYRQVGILTRVSGGGKEETILPLMGRPLFTRRDKWNFYTLNDKNNMIKLPVKVKGQSGTNEYGCDNIYNGDTLYVEGYSEVFKATIYDNNVMHYMPSYL